MQWQRIRCPSSCSRAPARLQVTQGPARGRFRATWDHALARLARLPHMLTYSPARAPRYWFRRQPRSVRSAWCKVEPQKPMVPAPAPPLDSFRLRTRTATCPETALNSLHGPYIRAHHARNQTTSEFSSRDDQRFFFCRWALMWGLLRAVARPENGPCGHHGGEAVAK